jgi:Uma2 family endonuclease
MDELPYDDGVPMESKKHRDQMNLLIEPLERHFVDRPDVFVGGNMALYYSTLQARNQDFKAPDVFVVLGAIPDRERKSWVVWEEDGRRPDVVIELLSDSTEREDRGRKMRVYAALGVSNYYLFDPHALVFEGYELDRDHTWQRLAPDASGAIPCPRLGLLLRLWRGVYYRRESDWLRWYDGDRLLPTGSEAAEEQATRAAAEATRAAAEATRAERLAARLRALGLDPDAG